MNRCGSCGHEKVFHLRYEEHWFGLQLKTFPIPCVLCSYPGDNPCNAFIDCVEEYMKMDIFCEPLKTEYKFKQKKGLWKLKPLMKTAHSIVEGMGFKVKPFEQLEKEANEKFLQEQES